MDVSVDTPIRRERLRVNGIVQGVGFRPFVYRLAQRHDLSGFVHNDSEGVCIEVEGPPISLALFRNDLLVQAPPLSRIGYVRSEDIVATGETGFRIETTRKRVAAATQISPDVAVCDDCLRELFDPSDRRFRYPFINCTNCGPRYTIVRRIPYDRPNTSMGVFPLCEDCEREYHDPSDRRFHAQPNACPSCGPHVVLCAADGSRIESADPIRSSAELLSAGKVVAVRGLGGFHLAVDPFNPEAVQRLRDRKGRAEKPLALMARDIETIRRFCTVTPAEESLLRDPARPIVLLEATGSGGIAPAVAPGHRNLGFMLAYTPLHHMLLRENLDVLVMTSANLAEEPIAISNDEAMRRLSGIADSFLMHDREILQRCDDSVTRVLRGRARVSRRSRGFVPAALSLPRTSGRQILAVGGELKNTIALARDREVFLSQHIGDLDSPETFRYFLASIDHLRRILEIEPDLLACDLHPEYLSTKWASGLDLPRIYVQHHHAHMAAVLAENGVTHPAIGIILDGTGFGTDGTIWGGEVLIGDLTRFDRFAWLSPLPLPGGEVAIRQPWRIAVAAVLATFGEAGLDLPLPLFAALPDNDLRLVATMVNKRINAPLCSSAGRLFDAVSALCNVRTCISYEAQAAIELEMVADGAPDDTYPFGTVGSGEIATTPLIGEIVTDIVRGVDIRLISSRFHSAVAQLFAGAARAARDRTGLNVVGLSGGAFQNAILFNRLCDRLQSDGFDVLTHSIVPTNDGGLSYGQVAVASSTSIP